jgi:hypothetical protein
MLEIKKVYIDTRFKTDGNSDSDFYIELPLSLNIPDKCICYVDDIVLPVSWNMIDSRNDKLYLTYNNSGVVTERTLILESGNYNGITFASALQSLINSLLSEFSTPVEITYDNINNKITILLIDNRADKSNELHIAILSDVEASELFTIPISSVKSLNGVLMLKDTTIIYSGILFKSYLDMYTTRNLYLVSSALGSYNTISNFNCDVIIKKIPVRYGYNEMLFDSSEAGYDYLDLSKRTLKRIDFKLQDAFGNIINLNGNHFSFSLIFQEQG